MAKISGLPTSVSLDDGAGNPQVITNDVTAVSFASPQATEDYTGLDKTAIERIKLLGDFTGTLTGWFNVAGNMSHAVLKTIYSSILTRTLVIGLGTGPAATLTAEVFITDYTISVDNGKLVWTAPFVLANGVAPAWT